MLNEVRYVPGAVDVRIQQPFNYPNLTVNVDRTRAASPGLTQQNVAQSLLVALSGSFQTSPNFYLDPRNGVSYNIAVQTPQYRMDTMAELKACPSPARRQPGARRPLPSTSAPGSDAAARARRSHDGRARRPQAGADPRQSGFHCARRRTGRRSATTTCSR